jgi:hypothetical protein
MARAAAVVRGQIGGQPYKGPFAWVRVPKESAEADGSCFLGNPRQRWPGFRPEPVTADCETMGHGSGDATVLTSQHRGQPFYYFVVGLPSLVTSAELGAYLMRLVGAVGCCALLASAFVSLLRMPGRRSLVLAAGVALTPAAIYLASVVNSVGIELAASFGVWSAGLALVRGVGVVPARVVHRMGLALVVLTLSRGLSPLFALVALAALAVLADRSRLRDLVRRTDVRAWLATGIAAAAVSGAWTLHVRSKYVEPEWPGSSLGKAFGDVPWWTREMIGVFGSTDVVPPLAVHLLWLGAAVALVVAAWRAGARLEVRVAGVLALLGFATLVSGQAYGIPQSGYWWQGRYVLPLIVGALLVAGARSRPISRRTQTGISAVVVGGHIWMFAYAVRHYTVGYNGAANPFDYLLHPVWSPPVPPLVLVLVTIGAVVAVAKVLARALDQADESDTATTPSTPEDDRTLVPATVP